MKIRKKQRTTGMSLRRGISLFPGGKNYLQIYHLPRNSKCNIWCSIDNNEHFYTKNGLKTCYRNMNKSNSNLAMLHDILIIW